MTTTVMTEGQALKAAVREIGARVVHEGWHHGVVTQHVDNGAVWVHFDDSHFSAMVLSRKLVLEAK